MTGRQPHDWVADFASVLAIIGGFVQALPMIATLLAIVYYVILIYESRTAQRALHARQIVEDAAADAQAKLADAAEKAKDALTNGG